MEKCILVTGGSGMVGQAIKSLVSEFTEYKYVFLSSKECDLRDYKQTREYFDKIKPVYVIHLAANVGGLFKNMEKRVQMFDENVIINTNVLKCSYYVGVKRLIACLSTCIFPDKTTYPIDEGMLHNGPPHCSNEPYAYAKRMLEMQCRSYNEQYGTEYICVIPTNIYGKYDNFHLKDAHVIPALIHKCFLAKKEDKPFIVYSSGIALRQFIYSKDLAYLICWVLFYYKEKESIILSVDEDDEISISDVAELIAKEMKYDNILFDYSYPPGQLKKTASNKKLRSYLPDYKFIDIKDGIRETVKWFIENYEDCRK